MGIVKVFKKPTTIDGMVSEDAVWTKLLTAYEPSIGVLSSTGSGFGYGGHGARISSYINKDGYVEFTQDSTTKKTLCFDTSNNSYTRSNMDFGVEIDSSSNIHAWENGVNTYTGTSAIINDVIRLQTEDGIVSILKNNEEIHRFGGIPNEKLYCWALFGDVGVPITFTNTKFATIKNSPITAIKVTVDKQGDRAIDEAKLTIPSTYKLATNDEITIVQDIVDLTNCVCLFAFNGKITDESGNEHHCFGDGGASFPRNDIEYKFENDITDDGFLDTTATEVGGSLTYTAGKIGTSAAVFNGSKNLILNKKENFNYDRFTPFTICFYINTSASTGTVIGKRVGGAGWEISLESGKPVFRLEGTSGTNLIKVTSDFTVNDNNWHFVLFTFTGTSLSTGITFFLDGALSTFTTSNNTLTTSIQNSSDVAIGSRSDNSNRITANLDNVVVINGSIKEEQMYKIFQIGSLKYVDGRFGDCLRLNGVDSGLEIREEDINFTGELDIYYLIRWSSSTKQYIYSRQQNSSNGLTISVNSASSGGVTVEFDGNTLNSSTAGYNDNNWHLIRVNRNASNLVSLYVDDVLKASQIIGSNLTLDGVKTTIGMGYNRLAQFAGDINLIRIYNGRSLSSEENNRLYTNTVQPISFIKFGGIVTKTEQSTATKNITCLSYGKTLGEIEIRGQKYDNRTPEFILEDLIRDNTDLIYHFEGTVSGIILTQFYADGKLIDILRDLTEITGKTFFSDGNKFLHVHDGEQRQTGVTLTHGVDGKIDMTKTDDTEIINDVVILGENKRYVGHEIQNGTGSNDIFYLVESPTNVQVTVGSVIQKPDVNYTVDSLNKKIVFEAGSIPASGTGNVIFDYEYEKPLYIRGSKQSSIDKYGIHSKRLIMPWIKTRNDGIRFISGYLSKFKDIRINVTIEIPRILNYLGEGDIITVINPISGFNSNVSVRSITWEYPQVKTKISAGEYTFEDFEYHRQVSEKIHDLESALTTIKDLEGFESYEEQLDIADEFVIFEANTNGTVFTETLNLTDAITITEVQISVYGVNYYSDDSVYGTGAVPGGFKKTGFTSTGFVTEP